MGLGACLRVCVCVCVELVNMCVCVCLYVYPYRYKGVLLCIHVIGDVSKLIVARC